MFNNGTGSGNVGALPARDRIWGLHWPCSTCLGSTALRPLYIWLYWLPGCRSLIHHERADHHRKGYLNLEQLDTSLCTTPNRHCTQFIHDSPKVYIWHSPHIGGNLPNDPSITNRLPLWTTRGCPRIKRKISVGSTTIINTDFPTLYAWQSSRETFREVQDTAGDGLLAHCP